MQPMGPMVGEPFAAGHDVQVIPTYWPVPNVGVLPMNAFVIRADEPAPAPSATTSWPPWPLSWPRPTCAGSG